LQNLKVLLIQFSLSDSDLDKEKCKTIIMNMDSVGQF